MEYFGNRQNPLKELSEDQLDRIFKEIVDEFGKCWLESTSDNHSLQYLWNRKDALSTNELFIFANALYELKKNRYRMG